MRQGNSVKISVVGASLLAGLALSATNAQAQFNARAVVAGKSLKLTFLSSINPDCTSTGDITVRITSDAQHGNVRVTRTRDFPYYIKANVRSACNTRRVPGIAVNYIAPRNYTGSDAVGIEVIFPNGAVRTNYYNISVR